MPAALFSKKQKNEHLKTISKIIKEDFNYNFVDNQSLKTIIDSEFNEDIINKMLLCSVKGCINHKRFNKDCCSVECANYKRGSSFRGKKRPKHSKKMKVIINNLINEGVLMNETHKNNIRKHVNSMSFKRKFLTNKGEDISGMDGDEILKLFSIINRKKFSTKQYKISSIHSVIKNEKYNIYTNDIKDESITDDNIDDMFKLCNSIKSSHAYNNSSTMGIRSGRSFNRGSLEVNYCRNNNIVNYKSGYELNYIRFFEENKLVWEYETKIIKLSNSIYTPDFLVEIDGLVYIIEVKGYTYYTSLSKEILKCEETIYYCNKNNYSFVYTFDPNPTIDSITSSVIRKIEDFKNNKNIIKRFKE